MEVMKLYLSLVIMLSVSSSKASSRALIWADTSGVLFMAAPILSSFSSSLIAKNLFWLSSSAVSFASTSLIAFSSFASNLCTCFMGAFFFARAIAFFASSSIPVPFCAEISTTSHPRLSESFAVLIWSPLFLTISIMLIAMMTGMPSSITCVERYRFLSRFVPSMILIIASGFSLIR